MQKLFSNTLNHVKFFILSPQRLHFVFQMSLLACVLNLSLHTDGNLGGTNKSTNETCQKRSACLLNQKEVLQNLFIEQELQKVKHLNIDTKREIGKAIIKASNETGLPKKLIWALIRHESSFKPKAISSVGAKGLTQLMPNTAKGFCGLKSERIFYIEENVICGSRYLQMLIKDFHGDLKLALAAYNVGPSRIKQLIHANNVSDFKSLKGFIPRSTRKYVSSIQSSYGRTVEI